MFRSLIKRFSRVVNESTMTERLRYFANPKPDYDTHFGIPKLSEDKVKSFVNQLVVDIEKKVLPTDKNGDDGVYLGTAGISYMFYHLSKVPAFADRKLTYLMKALQYVHPALRVAQSARKHDKDIPSFILGPAGVYAVTSVVYHSLGDENQSRNFREQYYNAANYCKDPNFLSCGSDELFVGRAGYIMGALWLAKETNTPIQKADLFELCKITIKSGRDYAARHKCPCPLMYSYYQVEYLGAAHGLCSIIQSILSVPGYLQENQEDQKDIRRAIDYLLSLQSPEGNFPAATDEIGHESKLVHWCHGAGGIFYLMAKAYLVFSDEKYLESCKKMVDLIWHKGLLKKGPGICHGVAGNGYGFLIMYRLTDDIKYLYRAKCFYEFLDTDTFRNNARTPDNPCSLYEGTAGTVCYLADLICPQQAVFPFSDIF